MTVHSPTHEPSIPEPLPWLLSALLRPVRTVVARWGWPPILFVALVVSLLTLVSLGEVVLR